MIRTARTSLALTLVLAFAPAAPAGELAGVTMPDSVTVDGAELVLNGLGLREATFLKVDVYVAGLYLPAKSSDAKQILGKDQAARLHMQFVRDVGKDSMVEAWTDGFAKNGAGPDLAERIATLNGWMADMNVGDTMTFTYVPGTGTAVDVRGETKGTIEGADFAKTLWSIWLGPKPPNAGLKKGLLGG